MTEEVQQAIEEIKLHYGELEVTEVSDGGARVIVKSVKYGDQYNPSSGWIGFVIGFQYPRADVYPHFVSPDLKRVDSKPLGEGFSQNNNWNEINTIQVSRRSNRLDPLIDTAATKLAKVLLWMQSR